MALNKGDLVEITLKDTWLCGERFIIDESKIVKILGQLDDVLDRDVMVYCTEFVFKVTPEKKCVFREQDLKVIPHDFDQGSKFTFEDLKKDLEKNNVVDILRT